MTNKVKKKLITFILLPLIMIFAYAICENYDWQSNTYIHIILETIITFITLFISVLALVRYYYTKTGSDLIIGCGYLSAAILSIYNAGVSSSLFTYMFLSDQSNFILSSEFLTHLFLSGFLCIAFSVRQKEKLYNKNFIIKENLIYALTLILIAFFIQLLSIVATPEVVFIKVMSSVPAFLYAFTLLGLLKKKDWETDDFEYWCALGLIILICIVLFSGYSSKIYDTMFVASHLLMGLSSIFVIIGFLVSIYSTFKQEKYNENRITSILNNMQESVITINKDCIIESCNPATKSIFGFSQEELIGKRFGRTLTNFICPMYKEDTFWKEECFLRNAFEKKDVMGKKKDGTIFPMELEVSTINFENKPVFLLVIRDITERKEIEKMKNEFISIVSHELRTPLTSIRGALGLINSNSLGEMPDKISNLVDIAYKNSMRLGNLINDILDIEKIEAGKMDFDIKPVSLVELIEQSIEANKPYAEQYNVEILIKDVLPDVKINADKERIMQVLSNLISNAAKFSPEGEKIYIYTEKIKSKIRISVKDNGSGIPKKFKPSIFKKFAQMDSSDSRSKGGTGLGLSICKAIVEHMNGSIGFETEENKGTVFYFDIPQYHEPKPYISCAIGDKTKQRVLVCEDDDDVASLINVYLEQKGYQTDIAYNSEQAMDLLTKNTYNIMTIDIFLPDKNGNILLKEIRKHEKLKDLPVIVISVAADEKHEEFKEDKAIIDWIIKPIEQHKLFNALKKASYSGANKPRILHVEDDEDVLTVVNSILKNISHIETAKTLEEAKDWLDNGCFDMVIIDIGLSDGNGLDLLRLIKKHPRKIFTVIFSAHDISDNIAEKVDAVLLKSKTSNQKLLETVQKIIEDNN